MEAIVLAGGLGTRLRSVVPNLPKPMAPIDEKGTPFLCILLDELVHQGMKHIILATGYKHEVISDYFGECYQSAKIGYSVEHEPLLTGGAIKKALALCQGNDVFVINGDTYCEVDYRLMLKNHLEKQADVSIVVKKMRNFDRYGTVSSRAGRICGFQEKRECKEGWINAGIYCLRRNVLAEMPEKFSFEKDFLEDAVNRLGIYAWQTQGRFVDMGVPDDYERAIKLFGKSGAMHL